MQKGAFVVFGSHASELGQIMDTSRGGLAFRYIACSDRSNGSSELVLPRTSLLYYR